MNNYLFFFGVDRDGARCLVFILNCSFDIFVDGSLVEICVTCTFIYATNICMCVSSYIYKHVYVVDLQSCIRIYM